MNNINVKDNIITAIRELTADGESTASLIASILNVGKESAYRRLRGEVNFSFEEVALIANEMGFSIDALIGVGRKENTLFTVRLLHESNFMYIYMQKLREYTETLRKIRMSSDKTTLRIAQNSLSIYSILKYPNLSKFYLYKWSYQTQKGYPTLKLTDFDLSASFREVQKAYISEVEKLSHFVIILDPNVYTSSILDIHYFYRRKLITEEEFNLLKKELLSSIDYMETISTHGISQKKATVEVYLSSIDIETSYVHIETENASYSEFPIYSIYSLDSIDKELSDTQKKWIDSLKKYSTSISQCGEIERYEYFNLQRNIINQKVD